MRRFRNGISGLFASVLVFGLSVAAWAGVVAPLPPAQTTGGMPLMEALAQRKSTRHFDTRPVDRQTLANLLWATYGVNRPDGRRTVPTARNQQRLALYVAMADGIWKYEGDHSLTRVSNADMRAPMGGGTLLLIYAAPEERWADMHVGSMYQNAGLFCASAGLGNVVRAQGVPPLDGVLPLPEGYTVHMVQAVGWPK